MVAATQAFRVSLCGLGVFGTYSSYANPQYNLLKDGILIATWGTFFVVECYVLLDLYRSESGFLDIKMKINHVRGKPFDY